MTMLKNWCLLKKLWKIATFIKIGTEGKKIYRALEFIQSQYAEFKTLKRIETEKKWWQRWKSVVKISKCFI